MVALERWLDVKDPLNAALRMPAHVDSEHAARHRVDELIELLGLESFRSKRIGELSTGSRRVVDLGCVLAHGPSVVLLALDQGEVLTEGPPAEVLSHPAVVTSYLGGDSAVIGRSNVTQPEPA